MEEILWSLRNYLGSRHRKILYKDPGVSEFLMNTKDTDDNTAFRLQRYVRL